VHSGDGGLLSRASVERKGFVELSFTAPILVKGGLKTKKRSFWVLFDCETGKLWTITGIFKGEIAFVGLKPFRNPLN
jgi:hypothetical protein